MGILAVILLTFLCYLYHADDFIYKTILDKRPDEKNREERNAIVKVKMSKPEQAEKYAKVYENEIKFKTRKIK